MRISSQRDSEEGFTLIELLIVILIVATLAAIAIPVFLAQREKGWVTQMKASLRDAASAVEAYGTTNDGRYTGATIAALETEGFKANSDITVTLDPAPTANEYCIKVTHSLLSATHDWKTATYHSEDGVASDEDACA